MILLYYLYRLEIAMEILLILVVILIGRLIYIFNTQSKWTH